MTRSSLSTLLFNLGLISFILANPADINNPYPNIPQLHLRKEIDWEISRNICKDVPSCKCIENWQSRRIDISCRCVDDRQIVNLKRSTDKLKYFNSETSWTIEKCGRVVIQPRAFSAVNGEYFDLHLMNLSSVGISEEAFGLETGKSENTTRKIGFFQVKIDVLPQKAFPSNLNVIQFVNCNIGTISYHAFEAITFSQIIFTQSTIGTIETKAFSESLLIDSWLVRESNFKNIRRNGVASSVTNMTWTDSKLDYLESFALSGDAIANASFRGNKIGIVDSNGLTLKDWSWISYVNNTFGIVNYSGIDLSKHSITNHNVTEFSGNTWILAEPDFIVASQTDLVLAIVRDNRLMESCGCGKGIISKFLTLTESNVWFLNEFRNNSKCYTTPKSAACIGMSPEWNDENEKVFVSYSDWSLFCNDSVFQCINELIEVPSVYSSPNAPPSRLRLLVILIGSVGVAIVICLVGVMLVYLCRQSQSSTKSSPSSSTQGDMTKVLGKGASRSYSDIVNKSSSGSASNGLNLSSRPRSSIFEEVEMEDKGVQTMPSELTSDVLEGLRAKLSHPDSFWHTKENIDHHHLYDLIHVRETSPLSSPPDVTILCNGTRSTSGSQLNNKPNTISTSISTSKLTRARPVTPRYAQIRSKPKTTPICEYGDPSDSQMHIYSELGPHGNNRQSTASTGTQSYLCEYTEPKDVQTHVYAELNSSYPERPQPMLPMTLPPVQARHFDPSTTRVLIPKNSTSFQAQIMDTPCPITPPCPQRPLPCIPSFYNVQYP